MSSWYLTISGAAASVVAPARAEKESTFSGLKALADQVGVEAHLPDHHQGGVAFDGGQRRQLAVIEIGEVAEQRGQRKCWSWTAWRSSWASAGALSMSTLRNSSTASSSLVFSLYMPPTFSRMIVLAQGLERDLFAGEAHPVEELLFLARPARRDSPLRKGARCSFSAGRGPGNGPARRGGIPGGRSPPPSASAPRYRQRTPVRTARQRKTTSVNKGFRDSHPCIYTIFLPRRKYSHVANLPITKDKLLRRRCRQRGGARLTRSCPWPPGGQ